MGVGRGRRGGGGGDRGGASPASGGRVVKPTGRPVVHSVPQGGGKKGAKSGGSKAKQPSGGYMAGFTEFEDEEDEFNTKRLASKSKIALDLAVDSDEEGEDDDDPQAVLGIAADDSEEDEDDEEDEEEDDEEDAYLAKLARQERLLRGKLLASAAADEDEEEEEGGEGGRGGRRGEEEDASGARWGSRKAAYYNADSDEEEEGDEEDAADEAAEALRLQRAAAAGLRPEDAGLEGDEWGGDDEDDEDDDEDDDEEEEEEEMGRAAARATGAGARKPARRGRGAGGVETEVVPRSAGGAGGAADGSDAPELPALMEELRTSLAEVRERLAPVIAAVRAGRLPTSAGVSLLEAKHLLLLSYCSHIVFYLMLRAEGRAPREHPVVERLVQLRAYLEKIRPVEKKLKYQIEKLLAAAAADPGPGAAAAAGAAGGAAGAGAGGAAGGKMDPLRFRPRPESLVPKVPSSGDADGAGGPREGALGGGTGVYRPPRLAPASMEDGGERAARKAERAAKQERAKMGRSSLLRELAADVLGAPEEVRGDAVEGLDAGGRKGGAARALWDERAEVEEGLFARLPVSREERQRTKRLERRGMVAQMGDFGDEVEDLVAVARSLDSASARAGPAGRGVGAVLAGAAAGLPGGGRGMASGDADLPQRAPLYERARRADAGAAGIFGRDEDFGGGGGSGEEEGDDDGGFEAGPARRRGGKRDAEVPLEDEDDMYQAAAGAADRKRAAKAGRYAAPAGIIAPEEEQADGRRVISRAIDRNRGLTPHRNKLSNNPRAKLRNKFSKASARRSGAVRTATPGAAGAYGGEATGIKSNISRSRRL